MKRRDQNTAQKEWDALKLMWTELDSVVSKVLLRGTHDSGIRKSFKSVKGDREDQTPPPAYNDETGESAIRREVKDKVEVDIIEMTSLIHKALNVAKGVIDISPITDVEERAKKTIPDCTLCGDPVAGRLRSGRWDEKCFSRFRRWVEAGNPADEKMRFEVEARIEMKLEPTTSSISLDDWRMKNMDTLKERHELP